MFQQFLPPKPRDILREGLPNLRHGTKHIHPLELAQREIENDDVKYDYYGTAAIYGFGFADSLKKEREIMRKNQMAFKITQRPSTLDFDIVKSF